MCHYFMRAMFKSSSSLPLNYINIIPETLSTSWLSKCLIFNNYGNNTHLKGRIRILLVSICTMLFFFRRGSLIADIEVQYEDVEENNADFSKATIELVQTDTGFTLLNQTAPVLSVQINETTGEVIWVKPN